MTETEHDPQADAPTDVVVAPEDVNLLRGLKRELVNARTSRPHDMPLIQARIDEVENRGGATANRAAKKPAKVKAPKADKAAKQSEAE